MEVTAADVTAPTSDAAETSITLHGTPLSVEVTRLLLEVDEGWVGYRHDKTWSWHEETYKAFAAICCDRKWPCNSRAACIATLKAIRTGSVSIMLSNATRSSEGYAHWSLTEMHELGAQMRRAVDDESQTVRWESQLEIFIHSMTVKDATYNIHDRTAEDFAARAEKFIPERTLLLIESDVAYRYETTARNTLNSNRATRSNTTMEPKQHTLLVASMTMTPEYEQWTRRATQAQALEDAGGSTEGSVLLGECICTKDATADLLSLQGEGGGTPTAPSQHSLGRSPLFLPLDTTDKRWSSSDLGHKQATVHQDLSLSRQAPPRQEAAPMRESSCQTERFQTSSRRYSVDQSGSVNGIQDGVTAMQHPTRKYRRVQQSSISDHLMANGRTSSSKTNAPLLSRNLNPYDRPGKLWGEFVVDVLLAEKTARNKDELDYVQFVRGLYEI
ncbi:unnamed protein product [Peronospora belbahrii]|uniref:Uncharacterized protein n=1 Tax=Peronospora belbahrii TaxID=622444 RepID=A0AAU9L5E6_9STRA|nr:unnamed protein product [Peronospora belbahrii]CAH0514936.1 unnamed protein product [Peronospora belbahrii]